MTQTFTHSSVRALDPVAQSVLRTLLYFDVFHFPLKPEEIARFLDVDEAPLPALEKLKSAHLVQENKGFWGVGEVALKVQKREEGAREADRLMPKAIRISKFLSYIPFVESVSLSGSISKGYMDKDSDIDYFLIVQPGRLWIVRFLFSIVLLGFGWLKVKKYFCPNYIMSRDQLQVGDRNRFTATEIHSLIPMYNGTVFQEFLQANAWSSSWFPQSSPSVSTPIPARKHRLEKIWNSALFSGLDEWIFRLYHWHYSRKFGNLHAWNLTPEDIRFRRNTYKMHNTGHRSRILETYQEKIQQFEALYQTRIQP